MKNLKSLRAERDLSQQQLAEQLGINQQSVNSCENRGTEPDIGMLMKMADFFHTSVDYLIGYDGVRNQRLKTVSTEEIRLLENLRKLPDSLQAHIKGIILDSVHILNTSTNNIDK